MHTEGGVWLHTCVRTYTQKQMVKKMCSLYIKSSMKFNNGSGRNKKFNDIVIIHNMESSDGVRI